MVRLAIIMVLAIAGLLGCSKVNPSDLVGSWSVDEGSLRHLPSELQKTSATMVLNENGTFTAMDMPGLPSFPPGPPHLVNGYGVWKLMSNGYDQHIQLNFQELGGAIPYGTQVYVSRISLSVELYYFLGGDEDNGWRIDLVKNGSVNASQ